MYKHSAIFIFALTVLVSFQFSVVQAETATPSIYFDDSSPTTMRLGNALYELGLRKTNGSIEYIIDKTTGDYMGEGSRHECLWGGVTRNNDYFGGCLYHSDGANKFSYSWSEEYQRLSLTFLGDTTQAEIVNVWIDVTPSTSDYLDMRLFLENQSGEAIDRVLFPSDLIFHQNDTEEILLPVLPGVILKPSFFDDKESYVAVYPSWPGVFADYLGIKTKSGYFSMYSIHKDEDTVSTQLGVVRDDEISASYYTYHTYQAAIDDEVVWTSPMVRMHIGKDFSGSLNEYRQNNHINQYSGLIDKLGQKYSQTIRSPMIKVDADRSIAYYKSIFPMIPSPAILHWVSYWQIGFDENYPDFLPTDSNWGTTQEVKDMFNTASSYGFLNMPYTNPTWWDDESATLQGQNISTITVIDENGNFRYECYTGHPNPPPCNPTNANRSSGFNESQPPWLWLHGGYAVSPYAPFVEQRLAQLMQSMKVQLGSDFVFEDQVGVGDRGWGFFDYGQYSPSATSYRRGWLGHTETYADRLLMTETGYDLLASTEIGFNGSFLLLHTKHETSSWWGEGNWRPFPLATMIARDKSLFYQHNLAPETFTHDLETLSWNLAMGYMLSYGLNESEFGGGLMSPWLDLVSILQREVLSEYADELVQIYEVLSNDATQTEFETFSVVTNWSDSHSYSTGGHSIVPGGVYIVSEDGQVSAGVFNKYNNVLLSSGDHYIVEKRGADSITVWQPIGRETAIALYPLSTWSNNDVVFITAYNEYNLAIENHLVTVNNGLIELQFQSSVGGREVSYYKLMNYSDSGHQVFLPMLNN